MRSHDACPCGSGRAYKECCAPLHLGAREASTPEELVRARFAAFATGRAEYLVRTLHAEHEDRARGDAELLRDLKEASRRLRFMELAILDRAPGRVLFRVKVFEKGKDRSFVELSEFAHDGTGWRYRAGTTLPAAALVGDASPAAIVDFERLAKEVG